MPSTNPTRPYTIPGFRIALVREPGVKLVAMPATGAVWPGRSTTLLTLGGVSPSPTLHARLGEVFELSLENRLAEATNMHWHGLAAPAEADGYPTDVVAPGGARQYHFQIAQRAGTYWYHPHPHGRTAAQVYDGMAGFLIVEDEEERSLGLPAGEQDVPLLLQDRRRTADGSFRYAPTPMDLMAGYLGDAGPGERHSRRGAVGRRHPIPLRPPQRIERPDLPCGVRRRPAVPGHRGRRRAARACPSNHGLFPWPG